MEYNKKNVGIIGYWFATNYGGVASYFSLHETIKKMGYYPFLVENPYFDTDKEGADVFSRNLFKEIGATICEPYHIEDLKNLNQKSDTFILGSDQVLTTSSIRAFGKLFLMEFSTDEKKRIAVSASCGGDNLQESSELVEEAKNALQRFDKVSVREFSGVETVRERFQIKADFMIDPIFFSEASVYTRLGEQVKNDQTEKEPYLLAYILDPTEDKREGIQKLSSTLGVKTKIALDGRKYTHDKNASVMNMPENILPELDFKEWLIVYANASYIITDSFHGAAMALILNKPVIIYANYRRGYPRFVSLIKLFGIKTRLIERTEQITNELINEKMDFEYINKTIEEKREDAKKWILHALITEKEGTGKIVLPQKTVNALLDRKKCVGCSACVNICPQNAIQLRMDDWGYYRAYVDDEKCIDCGRCAKICPALKLPKNDNHQTPNCYEFITANDDDLMNSSSGGIFTVMAKQVLGMKGAVAGVAWKDDLSVQHIFIEHVEDLAKLQKSKYLQSYVGTIFREVKEKIEKGQQVLFTGCPCQVAGLRSFLGEEYENLITVDLLCGNSPSTMFFQKYVSESFPEGVKSYSFRSKAQGYNAECISVEKADGTKIELRGMKEDAYQRVYHNHTMCAPHCEECQFQKLPRFGDLTIGDFWGLSAKDKSIDVSKGVSVVLCNSEKGERFFLGISDSECKVRKKVPLDWLGGNGYAIKNTHNYASPKRNLFYDVIKKKNFSEAVNYALKPNHGRYNNLYVNSDTPLRLDSELTHFKFDKTVWEEHFVNGKITLIVRENQWKVGRYANLSLAKSLTKGKKYKFSIRFRIKTAYHLINFHLRDAGTGCIQMIGSFGIPDDNNGSQWYVFEKIVYPDTDLCDQFMIGASQVSGVGNFFMIDFINIMEV